MKIKGITIFSGLVIASVGVAIIAGFIVMGSPSMERARQADQQRINHLQQISYAMDSYWSFNKNLPTSLEMLRNERNVYVESLNDPQTRDLYEYRTTGTSTYDLCATFQTDSGQTEKGEVRPMYSGPGSPSFWQHTTGKKCFSLKVNIPADFQVK